MHDFPRLVLDANIMVSALLGKSFPFLLNLMESGVLLFSTETQIAEVKKTLYQRPNITPEWADAQLGRLHTIIIALPASFFVHHEKKARTRLHARGQPDWPILAASYETSAGVWSHDKDLFGTGASVWSTKVLRKEMEMAGV